MHKCTCADCGRTFMTFELSWWCDDCRKKRFEKHNEKKKPTNADRTRAISDEDLAEYLIQYRDDWGDYCTPNCEFYDTYEEAKNATIKWLKQPAEEE